MCCKELLQLLGLKETESNRFESVLIGGIPALSTAWVRHLLLVSIRFPEGAT